jgi:NTP pyrophosphatase (non-canonical NTP hydrolase)
MKLARARQVGGDRWPTRRFHPFDFIQDLPRVTTPRPPLSFHDFQRLIRDMYFEKDAARGVDGTFMWLMEEVGELAAALREGTPEEQAAEFADVLAWLTTIANVAGIDLAGALEKKYGTGCPGCGQLVCTCDNAGKP